MGGWELAIPQTSKNKELTWELITLMVISRIMTPWLNKQVFFQHRKVLAQGPQLTQLNQTIPYYDKMVSMISIGKSRPVAPNIRNIAEHIRQAIEDVYYGVKQPKQALDDAAEESAKVLGW